MSRVDEALRRALEQGPNGGPALPGDRPSEVPDLDIDTLAQEPFPIEMREHRRPRKTAAENPPSLEPVRGGLPVMAAEATSAELFERVNVALAEKIVIDHNMAPVCREQYRRLAAILHHSQLSTGLSVVMVSSAVPGEGKTLTSANLALTFSESYHRNVLLIDADLRRPALHSVFRVDNASGLSDGLAAEQEHKMALRQVSARLAILPAGKATSDPMARLTSDRMRRLLQEARGSFDWVIIDTPPVALLPDAHLLTSMTDGALLVVKAGSTPHYLVKRAMEALGHDRILGAVLNRSTTSTNAGGCIFVRSLTIRSFVLVACDTLLIALAVVVGAYVRLGYLGARDVLVIDNGAAKALLIAFVSQTCLYYADLYDLRHLADRRELFTRILQALSSASFILAALYFWFPTLIIGRGVFVIAASLVIVLVIGWRVGFEWMSGHVGPRERLLLVGTNAAAITLAREMFERRYELGVEIVGFIDPDPARLGAPVLNPGVIGTLEDIPSIVRARSVDRVVVSLADARGKLPMDKLLEMKLDGVSFDHLASVYEEYTGKIAVENLRPSWLIFSPGFRKSRVVSAAKRSLDLFVAGVGLIIAAPVMALVALAIKLTSRGAVLYHQQRVGLHGRIFTLHKFRSMQENAEAATGPVWASKSGDSRARDLTSSPSCGT